MELFNPTNNNVRLDVLLDKLEEVFNTTIDRHTTEKEVLLKVGQKEVIDYIKELSKES